MKLQTLINLLLLVFSVAHGSANYIIGYSYTLNWNISQINTSYIDIILFYGDFLNSTWVLDTDVKNSGAYNVSVSLNHTTVQFEIPNYSNGQFRAKYLNKDVYFNLTDEITILQAVVVETIRGRVTSEGTSFNITVDVATLIADQKPFDFFAQYITWYYSAENTTDWLTSCNLNVSNITTLSPTSGSNPDYYTFELAITVPNINACNAGGPYLLNVGVQNQADGNGYQHYDINGIMESQIEKYLFLNYYPPHLTLNLTINDRVPSDIFADTILFNFSTYDDVKLTFSIDNELANQMFYVVLYDLSQNYLLGCDASLLSEVTLFGWKGVNLNTSEGIFFNPGYYIVQLYWSSFLDWEEIKLYDDMYQLEFAKAVQFSISEGTNPAVRILESNSNLTFLRGLETLITVETSFYLGTILNAYFEQCVMVDNMTRCVPNNLVTTFIYDEYQKRQPIKVPGFLLLSSADDVVDTILHIEAESCYTVNSSNVTFLDTSYSVNISNGAYIIGYIYLLSWDASLINSSYVYIVLYYGDNLENYWILDDNAMNSGTHLIYFYFNDTVYQLDIPNYSKGQFRAVYFTDEADFNMTNSTVEYLNITDEILVLQGIAVEPIIGGVTTEQSTIELSVDVVQVLFDTQPNEFITAFITLNDLGTQFLPKCLLQISPNITELISGGYLYTKNEYYYSFNLTVTLPNIATCGAGGPFLLLVGLAGSISNFTSFFIYTINGATEFESPQYHFLNNAPSNLSLGLTINNQNFSGYNVSNGIAYNFASYDDVKLAFNVPNSIAGESFYVMLYQNEQYYVLGCGAQLLSEFGSFGWQGTNINTSQGVVFGAGNYTLELFWLPQGLNLEYLESNMPSYQMSLANDIQFSIANGHYPAAIINGTINVNKTFYRGSNTTITVSTSFSLGTVLYAYFEQCTNNNGQLSNCKNYSGTYFRYTEYEVQVIVTLPNVLSLTSNSIVTQLHIQAQTCENSPPVVTSFYVNVADLNASASSSKSLSAGAIVGITLAVLVILIIPIWWFCIRGRKTNPPIQTNKSHESATPYTELPDTAK